MWTGSSDLADGDIHFVALGSIPNLDLGITCNYINKLLKVIKRVAKSIVLINSTVFCGFNICCYAVSEVQFVAKFADTSACSHRISSIHLY